MCVGLLGNRWVTLWLPALLFASGVDAQQIKPAAPDDDAQSVVKPVPTIDRYSPESMLKVAATPLRRSRFPSIDVHGHFGQRLKGDAQALARYVEVMDRNNIALTISLDAKLGSESEHLRFLQPFASRFLVFCHIDFAGNGTADDPKTHACNQPDFVRTVCEQLRMAKKAGIVGLKFFKQFGLGHQNADGSLIRINDRRFDPIWQACAELELPVLIHTADPAAFFMPVDDRNERLEELLRHPDWSFHADRFPRLERLLDDRNDVLARHPRTKFIGAHFAGNPEQLEMVGQWLDRYPNLYLDFSSRIGELGRQPFTARDFFIKYQDRILFGTDGPWPEERLSYYWRFLESRDEYFPYSEKRPQPQGLWYIYGLNLPDPVLERIYFRNSLQLLPSADRRYQEFVD